MKIYFLFTVFFEFCVIYIYCKEICLSSIVLHELLIKKALLYVKTYGYELFESFMEKSIFFIVESYLIRIGFETDSSIGRTVVFETD